MWFPQEGKFSLSLKTFVKHLAIVLWFSTLYVSINWKLFFIFVFPTRHYNLHQGRDHHSYLALLTCDTDFANTFPFTEKNTCIVRIYYLSWVVYCTIYLFWCLGWQSLLMDSQLGFYAAELKTKHYDNVYKRIMQIRKAYSFWYRTYSPLVSLCSNIISGEEKKIKLLNYCFDSCNYSLLLSVS